MLMLSKLYSALHLTLMAVIRFAAVNLLPTTEGKYQHPDSVGYRSWIEFGGKCLAFRRLDGSVQYKW